MRLLVGVEPHATNSRPGASALRLPKIAYVDYSQHAYAADFGITLISEHLHPYAMLYMTCPLLNTTQ